MVSRCSGHLQPSPSRGPASVAPPEQVWLPRPSSFNPHPTRGGLGNKVPGAVAVGCRQGAGGREGPFLEQNQHAGRDRRGPGRGMQRQGCLKDGERPPDWSPGVRRRSVAAHQQSHPKATWHLVRRAGFKPSQSRWEPTSLLKHYLNWQFQQRGPRTNEDHYWVQLHPLRCAVSIYQEGHRCIYHEE